MKVSMCVNLLIRKYQLQLNCWRITFVSQDFLCNLNWYESNTGSIIIRNTCFADDPSELLSFGLGPF